MQRQRTTVAKYAVVTGSTSGIGLSVACRLLGHGYFVFLSYARHESQASDVKEVLTVNHPGQFSIDRADLSSIDALNEYLQVIRKRTNSLNCLVLNVGTTDRTPFQDMTPESWQRVIDTNLTVPVFLVQGLCDLLVPQASVLFIGSLMGEIPHASSLAYGVSKAAVHFVARSLVKEFATKRVTVNAVVPGFVDTAWQNDKPDDARKRIEDKTALGRFATSEEIADFCYAVIHNPYLNGSVLDIDGGYDYR